MSSANDGRRQSPTGACVRCRDKKLKCDSRRPRCGTCISANAECEPAAPQVRRGPRKGYLKTLQDQVARLEQELAEAKSAKDPITKPPQPVLSPLHIDFDSLPLEIATSGPGVDEDIYPKLDDLITPPSELSLAQSLQNAEWASMGSSPELLMSSLSAGTMPADPMALTGSEDGFDCIEAIGQPSAVAESYSSPCLLQADLLVSLSLWLRGKRLIVLVRDQVYFERIHPSVPILHRQQYFAWAQSPSKTAAQICLQNAIWTSASSTSSRLQSLQESLYRITQTLLASSRDVDGNAAMDVEYVQAGILMTIYEFTHRNHHQGWMTAGHCFRLVQLMRLHKLDSPEPGQETIDGDGKQWIQQEEKRRAFWMAYCIDVLASKRGQYPLTLHEHVVRRPLSLPILT